MLPSDLLKQSSGYTKRIINEGSGSTPKAGDRLKIHYKGTLQNGFEFDSSYQRDAPFEFVIGRGQVIRGWDVGIMTMKVGERAVLTIQPDYGYGSAGVPQARIPPNAVLIFEVELIEIVNSQESSQNTVYCNLL